MRNKGFIGMSRNKNLLEGEVRDVNASEEVLRLEANDDDFLRTEVVPVFEELRKRNIVGFSDGEYWYEIAWYRQEEEE